MKKTLLILFIFVGFLSNAQKIRFRKVDSKFETLKNDSLINKKQLVENLKIKYLIDSLALTSLEAESFWPVYNEFVASVKVLRAHKNENEIKFEEDVFNLRKNYFNKLTKVFKSEERANKALRLDREFMKSLIKRQRGKHKRP